MNVTKKNFQECLPDISRAIKESSFLAIDGEFTGLNHDKISNIAFDTPEERYHKLLEGSIDFLLIQFGLCAFSYNGNTKQYTAKPFNFYIFPRQFSRTSPDVRFSCQSSSIEFLIAQGFDFNKVFREGISYLKPDDEARLKEAAEKKHEMFSSPSSVLSHGGSRFGATKGPIEIPPEQKDLVDDIYKKVEKFLESGENDTMFLPAALTAFQRKITYQTLQSRFGNEIHLQSQTGKTKERCIMITKVKGEEELKKLEAQKLTEDLAEIDAAVGFTQVIKMISQSEKLIVGHNMLLDIAHIINQFMYPLPPSYNDFKSLCRCVFPRLIDTKLMATTQPFKERIDNSGLSNLHGVTQSLPFAKPDVVIADDFDNKYSSTVSLHEAGYDAYVTGQCFISLSNFLGHLQNPPSDRVPQASPLLEPFLNKIFMMRSQDIPYMDLTAQDLSPSRDHVFHISFPKDWKSSDISSLFAQFGNVYIGWINETSAYVALNSKSGAGSVLKTLCKKGSVYRLMSYKDHKQMYHWHAPIHQTEAAKPTTASIRSSPPYLGTVLHSCDSKQTPEASDASSGHVIVESQNHTHLTSLESGKDIFTLPEDRKGLKRGHSPDMVQNENVDKKKRLLNVDAPEFQSRITPTTTPEKEDNQKMAQTVSNSDKKIDSETDKKMFPEPDWG